MSAPYPSLDNIKEQAVALRQLSKDQGQPISHSQSLEQIAHQLGHRDWNALYATVSSQSPAPEFTLGMRLNGFFKGQPFGGELIGVRSIAGGRRFGLTIKFDRPIDVVTFDSMTNFRRRVNVVVNQYGITAEQTSDGVPHLKLML